MTTATLSNYYFQSAQELDQEQLEAYLLQEAGCDPEQVFFGEVEFDYTDIDDSPATEMNYQEQENNFWNDDSDEMDCVVVSHNNVPVKAGLNTRLAYKVAFNR